ncbi:MAG: lipid-A-disaccharide synthase [Elusimicrobia bacterium]|nr:lipid-A-disaccharide synthase [Elusimicrobiota bacterium]
MSKILISAGDYSADMHGQSLVQEMRKSDPHLSVVSLGGVKLRSVSDQFLQDMVELDVSGFSQPFKQFFRLKHILQKLVFPILDERRVAAVVLIDYYGFNIHVAERAAKNKIPVFYFVSPQVWASRKGRIQKLKKYVTRMLVIFPFEEELYKRSGVPVTFVGHPLLSVVQQFPIRSLRPVNGRIFLGLLPGSRERELIRHIPLLIQSFQKLKLKFPGVQVTLFAADSIRDETYRSLARPYCPNLEKEIKIVRETNLKSRSELTLALTASGTATLENALLGVPTIVVYQTSWLTYWIAKMVIRVPYISMPNILIGKEIVPELIQNQATPDSVAQTAATLLSNPDSLERMQSELVQLRQKLGPSDAYSRAAAIIHNHLKNS